MLLAGWTLQGRKVKLKKHGGEGGKGFTESPSGIGLGHLGSPP